MHYDLIVKQIWEVSVAAVINFTDFLVIFVLFYTHVGVCHYQVQIVTSPNNGIFEATVRLSSGSAFVNPQLSRIDRYGDQPRCIIETHHHMREYCYYLGYLW